MRYVIGFILFLCVVILVVVGYAILKNSYDSAHLLPPRAFHEVNIDSSHGAKRDHSKLRIFDDGIFRVSAPWQFEAAGNSISSGFLYYPEMGEIPVFNENSQAFFVDIFVYVRDANDKNFAHPERISYCLRNGKSVLISNSKYIMCSLADGKPMTNKGARYYHFDDYGRVDHMFSAVYPWEKGRHNSQLSNIGQCAGISYKWPNINVEFQFDCFLADDIESLIKRVDSLVGKITVTSSLEK